MSESENAASAEYSEKELLARIAALEEALIAEKVKSAIISFGVDPKKVVKAAKLLDLDGVAENGELDLEKLREATQELLKEFPDFKVKGTPAPAIKIGSGGRSAESADEMIHRAFGNR